MLEAEALRHVLDRAIEVGRHVAELPDVGEQIGDGLHPARRGEQPVGRPHGSHLLRHHVISPRPVACSRGAIIGRARVYPAVVGRRPRPARKPAATPSAAPMLTSLALRSGWRLTFAVTPWAVWRTVARAALRPRNHLSFAIIACLLCVGIAPPLPRSRPRHAENVSAAA